MEEPRPFSEDRRNLGVPEVESGYRVVVSVPRHRERKDAIYHNRSIQCRVPDRPRL